MTPPLRRLLFAADYAPPADCAFAHAAFLAERTGAELHVVHVTVPTGVGTDASAGAHRHAAPAGVRLVEKEVAADAVVDGVLDYAREIGADLLVAGTHGHRGAIHLMLGSVAERLVRLAPCPVLVVGPRAAPPADGLRRLLVPTDFSPDAEAALRYAAALADLYGARVELLHAVEIPALPDTYGLGLVWPGWGPEVTERSEAHLAALAERHLPAERRGPVHVEIGDPAAVVLDAAERLEADLLVLSTHGRTGLTRFALGSVAERVVQRAACPVLVVKRPPGPADEQPDR